MSKKGQFIGPYGREGKTIRKHGPRRAKGPSKKELFIAGIVAVGIVGIFGYLAYLEEPREEKPRCDPTEPTIVYVAEGSNHVERFSDPRTAAARDGLMVSVSNLLGRRDSVVVTNDRGLVQQLTFLPNEDFLTIIDGVNGCPGLSETVRINQADQNRIRVSHGVERER